MQVRNTSLPKATPEQLFSYFQTKYCQRLELF